MSMEPSLRVQIRNYLSGDMNDLGEVVPVSGIERSHRRSEILALFIDDAIPVVAEIRQLTDEEKRSLVYFHQKGDITRYVHWDDLRPILVKWHPDILEAVESQAEAERALDAAVQSLK